MNDGSKKMEQKWQKRWEEAGIFKAKIDKKKKKYYVLEMFPYPSAAGLHMGHIRNYSMGDAFARYKRMCGFNVLYPMGYDAFGLPAENAAIKSKTHPKEYTKKAIEGIKKNQKALGLSYDWSREISTCEPEYYKWNQWFFLKMLEKGLAYKKEAPVNWCPGCKTVLANEQVNDGKCWRCESPVEVKNLKQWFFKITDYADELLKNIDGLEWPQSIKAMQRNWIGRKEGYEQYYKVNGMDITLATFTTHHHTSFAEIFLALAPEHPLSTKLVEGTEYEEGAKAFIKDVMEKKIGQKFTPESAKDGYFTGRYAKDPCNGNDLPIYIADFALMDFGTGIVKASCHDQRDFDFANAHNIELIEVLFPNKLVPGETKEKFNIVHPGIDKSKMRDYSYDGPYNEKIIGVVSLQIKEKLASITINVDQDAQHRDLQEVSAVRQLVYTLFNEMGIEQINLKHDGNTATEMEDIELMGFVWSNGKFVLEKGKEKVPFSYDGQGYMFRSGQFNGMSVPEAKKKIGEWMIKKKIAKKTVTYGIRDWGISRQRYWGTPIPVIYCDKCGIVPVPEKELPVSLPVNVKFTGHGNPLGSTNSFVKVKCPKCGGNGRRETDTMDTFVDSSWYFLRYCSPTSQSHAFNKNDLAYWMPVDQYIGGAEHAVMHLLYARFFTMVLRDMGLVSFSEPFTRLFNQGIVYKDGHKMSKSFGNVVTQEEVANKYGIDTARLFLLFVASPDSQLEWNDKSIIGSFKFLKKLESLVQELKTKKNARTGKHTTRDNQMLAKAHSMVKHVTVNMESFMFNKAIGEIMKFFGSLSKYSEDGHTDVMGKCIKMLLLSLSPFAPHLSEELWEAIGSNKGGADFICTQSWPKANESLIDPKLEMMENIVEQTRSDIKDIIRMIKKSPEQIIIYIAPLWKYEVHKTILNMGENKKDVIATIMKNPAAQKEGKAAAKFAQRLTKSAVLGETLEQSEELQAIQEALAEFSREFGCKVLVSLAEEKRNDRSLKAEPAKPGIEIS